MRGNFIPPLYSGPLAWLPPGYDHGDPDFFSALLAAPDVVLVMLAQPYDSDAQARALGLNAPLLRKPLAWSPYFTYRGRVQTLYLGDHHGYISHATDMPASYPFPSVLGTVYGIEVGIGGSEQDRLAPGNVSFGDTVIDNGTGDHDALTNYAWGGRLVEIKAGLPTWPLSRFVTVLRGNVRSQRSSDGSINLGIASRDGILDNPLTRIYYGGTGGEEGPLQLAGQPVVIVLGRCRNVGMVLLDAGTQIWRVGEKLGAVLAVRNRGLAVDDSGNDYTDFASLAAAVVAPGEYATCLALGLIRFGSNVSVPTADVDGPADWGSNATAIIQYLLRNRLGLFNLSAADIDGGSFNTIEAQRDWRLGIVIESETTMRPVTDRLVRSIGGWMIPNRRGLFQVGLYEKPTSTTGTVTGANIDDAGPELVDRWRAVRKLTLYYKPMWRPMTGSDLAETVSASDRNLLTKPWRPVEPPEERSVADRDAVDYEVVTDLDDVADATQLAAILADLLAWGTHRWLVPLRDQPFRFWAGDRRTLSYPRHGLDRGAKTLAVRVVESDQGDNSILLWGGKP